MRQLKLLIVDDDPAQVQLLKDAIKEKKELLKVEKIEIVLEISTTKADALVMIENNFDYAIIDLKLSNDKTKTEGNEVIKEIKQKMRFPVLVLSNAPGDLDPVLGSETDIFKVKERTEITYSNIVDEIILLYNSGLSELFGQNGQLVQHINKALHDLFWKRVAHNWNYLTKNISDSEERLKIIAKQLTILLKEEMEIGELNSGKALAFEMYLMPPVRRNYYTGDIIEKEGNYYIILSPACDMELRNGTSPDIENISIASLVHLKNLNYTKQCWIDGTFQNSKQTKLENLIHFKKSEYHLLPPFKDIKGFVIDFSSLSSIPYNELQSLNRIACITEPYLKNIISRFSNHFNRLGQPDFFEEKIIEEIKSL